ncbi:MAG: phage tail protein [Gammaproteobacteria bacterium]
MKRNSIEPLLPDVFRRTLAPETPLSALLDVMAALQAPAEMQLDQVEATFNPYRTPDRFVEFLAIWVDLDRLWAAHSNLYVSGPGSAGPGPQNRIDSGRLRELIAHASYLSQWRGTVKGMLLFLKVATGFQAFEIVEGRTRENVQKPFHFIVRVPEAAKSKLMLIKTIIEQEKPVYTTFEIDYISDEAEGEQK